ncbi:MAG: Ig-like domain-containing protein, partial [Pirellulales bacterium]
FNDVVYLPSLLASDFKVDGATSAVAVSQVDGDTFTFTIPGGLAEGLHTLSFAAGSVLDVQQTPLDAFSSTFFVDLTGPRVTATSLAPDGVAAPGSLSYQVTFDEAMQVSNLSDDDFSLRGNLHGIDYFPSSFSFDAGGTVLTLNYDNLPDDNYTLTLLSGADGGSNFTDAVGNAMDGEFSGVFPSGDGGNGGDFLIGFNLVPGVVQRQLFYNDSAFDGSDPAINASDDGAIAPDKTAYLPGAGLAGFQNVSSYSRGINGIMIDVVGLPSHGASLTANDFVFKVGVNNSPDTWAMAPVPTAISVRAGAGASGSDRVEITWANNAIMNQWLMVATKSTINTGLVANNTVSTPGGPVSVGDVFFFGNRIGDTGSPTATSFTTTTADASTIVSGGLGAAGGITNVRDIDKSNMVTMAGDRGAALGNVGALNRLNVGTGAPLAPEAGDTGISSALAAAAPAPLVTLPPGIARRLQTGDLNAARIAAYFWHMAEIDSGRFGKLAAQADLIDNTLELDEELVASLAGGL